MGNRRKGTKTPGSEAIRVELAALPPLDRLASVWIDLQERSRHSYFLSWAWIGLWLEMVPGELKRELLRAECSGRVVGLAVLCSQRSVRGGVIRSRALYLNCTGDSRLDELTIEYNGLLAERGLEDRVAHACFAFLLKRGGWDEFVASGISDDSIPNAARDLPVRVRVGKERPVPYVDLAAIRREGRSYLDMLSRQARSNLRRAVREGERLGGASLDAATSLDVAMQWLAALGQLHQRAWNRKGEPGAFANEFFEAFHKELVRREWAGGGAQLLRISVSSHPVGYLYNLVHDGRVCQYQSGFDFGFSTGSAWRPGLMSHLLAIERYGGADLNEYDFMAGEHLYKRQLSTSRRLMRWFTLQRPRLKFAVEDLARLAVRRSIGPRRSEESPLLEKASQEPDGR